MQRAAAQAEREANRWPVNPLEVPVVTRPPLPQHKTVTISLGQTQIVLDSAVPVGFEAATLVFIAGVKLVYKVRSPVLATEYTVAGDTVTFGLAPVAGSFVEVHGWRSQ